MSDDASDAGDAGDAGDAVRATDAGAVEQSRQGRQRRVKRRRTGWRNADIMRTTALVIGVYLLLRLIWIAHPLFLTAFLGILFGLAVSSGVDALSRWRIPRGVSAGAIVIAFFAVLIGFGAWMAPTLHEQGIELRRQLPAAIDRMGSWLNARRGGMLGLIYTGLAGEPDSSAALPGVPNVAADTQAIVVTALRKRLSSQVGGATRFLFPFLSSTIEVVTGIVIILFLSIYTSVDPQTYRAGILHLFPHHRRARIAQVLTAVAAVLRKWLVTQLIAMVVMGIVTTVVLLALHVRAAFALGLLAGLLEFIPTAGALIASAPAIAMGFLDSPEKALWVTLAYVGVHFLEGHLLIPLLMKGGIDLPPALTIFSQALMAILFGFLGLMCAVPLLAATMTAVKMLYVEDVVGDPQLGPHDDPQKGVE